MGSLKHGKSIHGIRDGIELDSVNYTSLTGTYAKCGSVVGAPTVVKEMATKMYFIGSVMISAFGVRGLCNEAIAVFDQMISDN